jgi:hypothetical protein
MCEGAEPAVSKRWAINLFGAFVPSALPQQRPVDLTGLVDLLDHATVALGRLDGVFSAKQRIVGLM